MIVENIRIGLLNSPIGPGYLQVGAAVIYGCGNRRRDGIKKAPVARSFIVQFKVINIYFCYSYFRCCNRRCYCYGPVFPLLALLHLL
jgi:hypothetical protein